MDGGREAIIDALYVARSAGSPLPALDPSGLTRDGALEVQLGVLDRFVADGSALGGWKVGLTSGRARDRMGKLFRPFGFILDERILPSGSFLRLGSIWECKIEPELCLIMGAHLYGGGVSARQARAAVSAVAPAFEINERRASPGQGDALLVADGLAQWGIVVGPAAEPLEDLRETTVELYVDDRLVDERRPGASMDDPYVALSRVCRLLSRFGLGLEPGQRVMTGSFTQHVPQAPGIYRAAFSDLGSVSMGFR